MQVVLPAAISAFLAVSVFVEESVFELISSDTAYWLESGTLIAITLPACFVNPADGLALTGISLGMEVGEYELDVHGQPFLSSVLFSYPELDLALFSAYVAYRDNRVRAQKGLYSDSWRKNPLTEFFSPSSDMYSWKPESAWDLAASPFMPGNLANPDVWLISVESALEDLAMQLSELYLYGTSSNTPVWATGSAYIGTTRFDPLIGIPLAGLLMAAQAVLVAVGEEALFRGVIHEEAGSSFGGIAAYAVDPLIFAACHLPGDFMISNDWQLVTANFLDRVLGGLEFDLIYDSGGLPLSVATHFWVDFPLFLINYLFDGGAPSTNWYTQLMGGQAVKLSFRVVL